MTDINTLARRLERAKQAEQEAREARIQIESDIYEAVAAEQEIPEKGTVKAGPIKITTQVGVSWDQPLLAELAKSLPPAHFPFNQEYKADTRALNKLAASNPTVYRQIFAAMTTKPRKPQFQVEWPKEDEA